MGSGFGGMEWWNGMHGIASVYAGMFYYFW